MADETLTSEDLSSLQKDIENAKKSLSSKPTEDAIQAAKEAGRLEAERELKYQQQLSEEKAKAAALEQKLKEKELEAATQLTALQRRVDEIVSSKGVVANNTPTGQSVNPIDKMTDAQIDKAEIESARAFFGPSYDRYSTE